MGFGDRLKGLRDQAQQTVAENKDKIQGAVQSVGEAANVKTHGKYADKIARVGDKVEHGVHRFAGGEEADAGAPAGAPAAPEPSAGAETPAPVDEPVTPAAGDPSATAEGATPSAPDFE